jgi:exosortase K
VKVKVCVALVAAMVIWGAKRHYAAARADDLWWILGPTARLVTLVTGTTFAAVPSEGYVSQERMFVIEKSCAGINFGVAAFGMLVFVLFHRVQYGMSGVWVLGGSLAGAYGAAVLVNTARIAIALWLLDRPIAPSTLTPTEVHRFEGIAVYFAGLVLLYEIVRWTDRRVLPVRSWR